MKLCSLEPCPGTSRFPFLLLVFLFLASPWTGQAQKLEWVQEAGYRLAKLPVAPGGKPGFTLQTGTGIAFTNFLSYKRSEENQNLINGAGLAAGDYDGDGWCDLYFANLEGSSGLFRNLGGWKFENTTVSANAGAEYQTARGPILADLNGDGWLDLLVSAINGTNFCLLNNGRGGFNNAVATSGLIVKALGSQSMALADIDGDGDLDLYVANYGENSILRSGGAISVRTINGKPVVRGRYANRLKIVDGQMIEQGEPHLLYLNDGQARFTPVSWTDGRFRDETGAPLKAAPRDMGLSVMFRDINRDGVPDIYVCNDFQSPDRIWLNDGRGYFRALASLAIRSTPQFSMGVDFADIDRDGWDDLVVCDMLSQDAQLRLRQIGATNPPIAYVGEDIDRPQFRRNSLFLNRGDGTYTDIANFAGLDATEWSWSVVFLDVDLDGYEDLLVANGHAYDTQDLDMHERRPPRDPAAMSTSAGKSLKEFPLLRTPNVAYRNRGNRTFEETGAAWGFDSPQVSHGIALADLDNDGDQDVAVSCLGEPPLLYRNNSSAPRVAVRLKGAPPNTAGIGARITLGAGKFPQSQEVICGGRYQSSDQPMRVFAMPDGATTARLEVLWRNGRRSVLSNIQANYCYEIDELATAQPAPTPQPTPPPAPLFKDASSLLGHKHFDQPFGDLERQPLLHRQFSSLGPGLAWFDLNRDGHDDLIIGAGRGGTVAIYGCNAQGLFNRWTEPALSKAVEDDITGVVGWTPRAGVSVLVMGAANYEEPSTNRSPLLRYNGSIPIEPLALPSSKSGIPFCPGPVATADYDGDGDLDFFVGGRLVPGRYPEPATSRLYLNNNGSLQPDERSGPLLRHLGLVSGAVWSDLNSDGWPELIVACEWGPIRVWQNNQGTLQESQSQGLNQTGWWNGVTTGDIDGDGRLDIIASNWGRNSSYHESADLYYLDIDGNGSLDLFETWMDPKNKRTVLRRDMALLSTGWPLVRSRFRSHKLYSQADLAAVVGKPLSQVEHRHASTMASTCFFNRGSRFEPVPLPFEAQLAPAWGINVADFDGDGHEDIFLSQNFFAMRPEEPRLDAGRGLLLRGTGSGLETVIASGLIIYGEQRGSATCDYDSDGRVDLAVAQNNGETKLFHNERARPGLRVRLQGPPLNPSGIGAVMRLQFGDKLGPARIVHGGSGYLSYDSTIHVLAMPTTPSAVQVVWPGGNLTTFPIPSGAREITVKR